MKAAPSRTAIVAAEEKLAWPRRSATENPRQPARTQSRQSVNKSHNPSQQRMTENLETNRSGYKGAQEPSPGKMARTKLPCNAWFCDHEGESGHTRYKAAFSTGSRPITAPPQTCTGKMMIMPLPTYTQTGSGRVFGPLTLCVPGGQPRIRQVC